MAGGNVMKDKDYFLQRGFFVSTGGFKESEFREIIRKYPECGVVDEGYPVFRIMSVLNKELREAREKIKQTEKYMKKFDDSMPADLANESVRLDMELKHEKVIEKRISNQIKLGELILKDEGKDRVAKSIQALMALVKHIVTSLAAELPGNRRTNEKMLSRHWNQAVRVLEDESTNLSWEEDGGVTTLKTRLKMLDDKTKGLVDSD